MNAAVLKTPPHSQDAESMVIGAIATFPGAWDRVVAMLRPRDFYGVHHRSLFEYAVALDAANEPVDGATLSDYAIREGNEPAAMALAEAAETVTSAHNLEHYAKIVRERKLERELIAAAVKIGEIGFQNVPTDEKLNQAQALIMGLTAERSEAETRPIAEVLKSVVAEIERRFNTAGQFHGLPTGFIDLDRRWGGMKPGNLIVIAGRPAMGKTTLAMNIAEHVARIGCRVLVFSLEMGAEELVERMVASDTSIPHEDIRTGKFFANADASPAFARSVAKLRDLDLLIDDTAGIDLARIRGRVRQASTKRPVDLIVVDHLQLMNGEGRTQNEVVGGITKGLKHLAKEARCPVILLSQLNREVDKRPYGKNRPIMSDLRDSGSIEQDSDIVAFVYRNVVYKQKSAFPHVAEIITSKFRNGRPGTEFLREDFSHCRFQSYAGDKPMYDAVGSSDPGFNPEEF